MTVVCINDKWTRDEGSQGVAGPAIGDKETVYDIYERYGNTYYLLEKYGDDYGFMTAHFVAIDDTPAEVIEEEETELQTA